MSNTVLLTTPACIACGTPSTIAVPADGAAAYAAGALVQVAFPDLPVDEREVIISGIHPACWDDLFG